jgi:uncharacterized protein YjbK
MVKILEEVAEMANLMKLWYYTRETRKFRDYYRKHPLKTKEFDLLDTKTQHYVRCLFLEGNITLEHPEECGLMDS